MRAVVATPFFALALVFLAAFSAAAFAHEANFVLSKTSAALCPGGTIQISATITNTGATEQTFTLSSDSNWATIAPASLTIDPGNAGTAFVYITPAYTAQAGNYDIEILAKHPGGEEKATVALEVLTCFGVGLKADKTSFEGCAADKATFDITVTNAGKYSDTYKLATSAGTLDKNEVTVDSGKSAVVKLTAAIEKEGASNITVTASSASGSAATLELTTKGVSCYAATLKPRVVSKTVCSGDSATYVFDIENTGKRADEFEINASQGTVTPANISLNPGEKKSVTLSVTPKELGAVKVYLTAKSPRQTLSTDVTADVGFCRGVAVIGTPPSLNVCGGAIGRFQILVKNTGRATDKFTLSSTLGSVSQSLVEIDAGAIKELFVEIPTNADDLGNKTFTVNVKSTGEVPVIDSTTGTINIEACYSADLIIEEPTAALCPADTATFEVLVKNTGKVEETFKLTSTGDAEVTPDELTIGPNKTASATLKVSKVGEYNVSAASTFVTKQATVSVVAKPADVCYGFTIAPKGNDLEQSDKALFTLVVKNTGEKAANYTVDAQAPDFASIDPRSFTLAAKDEKEIFVYIAPPVGTTDGIYKAKVSVTSDKGAALDKTVALAFGNVSQEELDTVRAELAAEAKAAEVPQISQAGEASANVSEPSTPLSERVGGAFNNTAVIALIVFLVIAIILIAAARARKGGASLMAKFRPKRAEMKEAKAEKTPKPRKKRKKSQPKPEQETIEETSEETGEIA